MKLFRTLLLLIVILTGAAFTLSLAGGTASYDNDLSSSSLLQSDQSSEDDSDETDDETETEDSDEDEKDEEEKRGKYEREMEIEVEDDKVKIKSKLKQDDAKDEIEFEIELDDSKVKIKLKYEQEAGKNKTKFKYRVEFREVIVYVENGTTPGYQEGENQSVYKIGKTGWDPIVSSTEGVAPDTINVFTATTADKAFSIIFKISEKIINLTDAVLTPNSVKIDVKMNGTLINTESVSGYSLALKAKIKTELKQKFKTESTEENLGFGADEDEVQLGDSTTDATTGFFSWEKTAVIDGNTVDVITSAIKETFESDEDDDEKEDIDKTELERHYKTYISFDAIDPVDVYWDPKVGVVSQGTVNALQLTAGGIPGFELLAVLLLLGTASIYQIRKNRKK